MFRVCVKFKGDTVTIDVKSDKARELKRDMFALLRECMDVHMFEDSHNVEFKVRWKMDGKVHEVCHYTMPKRSA